MLQKLLSLGLAALVGMSAAGCRKEEKTQAEIQAEKVRAFREKQKKAAVRAYQEIVEKYPDSPFAAQAKARLQELGPVAGSTPKSK